MKKIFYSLLFLFFGYSTVLAQQQVTCGVFTFDVLITPVTCNGDCDGAIQITNISGGTPSYTTFWSTGSTVPSIFNLCADDYTIFISDAMGDTCSMTFTVLQPAPIQVSEIVTDASCTTCCDGAIVLTPTGGTPPYNYVFTPSGSPINLCPDTYSYCVTDINGCSTCDTVVVSFPTTIKNKGNITTDFSIYPNPNNGSFIIDIGNFESATIEIYNISGRLILKETLLKSITPINLKENPKGIYFVKVTDGSKVLIKKVVKQ